MIYTSLEIFFTLALFILCIATLILTIGFWKLFIENFDVLFYIKKKFSHKQEIDKSYIKFRQTLVKRKQ